MSLIDSRNVRPLKYNIPVPNDSVWEPRISGSNNFGSKRGIDINDIGGIVCTGEYGSSPAIIYDSNGQIGATLTFEGIVNC